jgi:ferredoxin
MRVRVDQDQCCSSGMCTLLAPEVFDQDVWDGQVILLDPTPPPDCQEAVRQAIQACPCGAISEDTGPAEQV